MNLIYNFFNASIPTKVIKLGDLLDFVSSEKQIEDVEKKKSLKPVQTDVDSEQLPLF